MARESTPAADPTVSLREASATDVYFLWLWANDVESRRASHGRELIPWPEHRAWFETRLNDAGTMFFVAEAEDHQPVGCIRFETTDRWSNARLSYLVAPEARGRGFARAIISAGCDELRGSTAAPGSSPTPCATTRVRCGSFHHYTGCRRTTVPLSRSSTRHQPVANESAIRKAHSGDGGARIRDRRDFGKSQWESGSRAGND